MCALGPDIHALQAACSVFLDTCRCPLCALPWRKASTFPCGHTFCYDCAIATLEGPGISQSECPTCKGKYWKRDLRPNPQMMAVVEHTQRILSIAVRHATGAASDSSGGGQAATDTSANHDGQHNVSGILLYGFPPGNVLNCTEQERACTAAEVPAATVRQKRQYGAKQGDGAGSRSPALVARSPTTSRAASLPLAVNDAAARWAPEQAQRLEAASDMLTADQMRSDSAGAASARQAAIQPYSLQILHVRGPISPHARGEEPIIGDDHARCNGPRCLSEGNDHAHRNQPFVDAEQLAQSANLIIGITHGTVGARECTPSVLQALAPAEAEPGGPMLPAISTGEGQHCSRVRWAGSDDAPAGSQHGVNALASAPNTFYPARGDEVVSATPSVHGGGFAGDTGTRPLGPIPSATATPNKELLVRWRSQLGGSCATMPSYSKPAVGTATGTCGGRLLPGSVVSIRLDIPSVNNAYLDFHGLLEQTTNWTARQITSPRRTGEHLVQACSHGDGDEGCRNSVEFEESACWFQRLAELADPTDQEREALEFELSHVSVLLEEMAAMMAELEASGGCIVPVVANVPAADRTSVGRGECVARLGHVPVPGGVAGLWSEPQQGVEGDASLRCGDGIRTVQELVLNNGSIGHCSNLITGDDMPVPSGSDRLDVEQLRARAISVSQTPLLQQSLLQREACNAEGASSFSAGALAPAYAAACPGNGATAQVPIHQEAAEIKPFHDDMSSAFQGHVTCGDCFTNCGGDIGDRRSDHRGDSCDQQQVFYDSGSGGSCHPVVECAQETATANDNDEPTGHGERSKRRTEVRNSGFAKPRTSPPLLRLPDCRVFHAVPSSQQQQQVLSTLQHVAPGPGLNQGADAGAPAGVDVLQALAAVPSVLAPRASSPELWLHQGPEQGLENAGCLGAEGNGQEANAHRRRDRAPAKRYRSEPANPPLEPLSLNTQQLLQQQGEEEKDVQASLRQTRRAKARERGSAAAAMPPGSGLELAAPGPAARRLKPAYVVTSGVGPEGRARLKELTRRVRGVELLSDVQPQLTHLVVNLETERRTTVRTIKYLRAVIQGCWVVGMEWVEACLAAGRLVQEGPYEAAGDNVHTGTPAITRLGLEKGYPPLFSGIKFCVMYLKGSFDGTTKPELEALLLAAGATLVRRPTRRTAAAPSPAAPVTAAAALFGAAAADDLYDGDLCTQRPTPQPADGSRLPPGFPPVFVLVAPYTNVDVARVIREWGCAPVQTQWVFDCISWYKLLPLDSFRIGRQPHSSTMDMS
ncbi:hypothetical protein VaNZ11_012693 [Volvox africanus]|uniref:RING-type E3 ubiquitin transferase BRCA1 n=1 Tax=Volvox africanus TaxID=51714 RepID=A0ABQ5SF16_9CHLO|nr:hypothetical protein VaNZ11_012693 [Volvox africanus]